MKYLFASLVALLLCITPALAQSSSSGLAPCGVGKTLNVTTTSSNVQLNTCGTVTVVWNLGDNEAFLAVGKTNAAVATADGWSLPAKSAMTLNFGISGMFLAAITGSATTTIRITQGTGAPAVSGPNP